MSSNPINLLVRFLLEISTLVAMGMWGWQKGDGFMQFMYGIGVPLIAATLWGGFRFPNDPGKAPIAVPGYIRLFYEIIFFGFAIWALFNIGYTTIGWIFLIITVIHYVISYDRIFWLLNPKRIY